MSPLFVIERLFVFDQFGFLQSQIFKMHTNGLSGFHAFKGIGIFHRFDLLGSCFQGFTFGHQGLFPMFQIPRGVPFLPRFQRSHSGSGIDDPSQPGSIRRQRISQILGLLIGFPSKQLFQNGTHGRILFVHPVLDDIQLVSRLFQSRLQGCV